MFSHPQPLMFYSSGCPEKMPLTRWLKQQKSISLRFGTSESQLLHVGFLYLLQAGPTVPCGAQVSLRGGFSCGRTWVLGMWALVVVAPRP